VSIAEGDRLAIALVKIDGEINYQVGIRFDLEIKRIVVICGRKRSVEQLTE